jgi:hypothetical protein
MCSHVIRAKFNLLWVLNRCMLPTNEKSHAIEVGTWLGGFDMT